MAKRFKKFDEYSRSSQYRMSKVILEPSTAELDIFEEESESTEVSLSSDWGANSTSRNITISEQG